METAETENGGEQDLTPGAISDSGLAITQAEAPLEYSMPIRLTPKPLVQPHNGAEMRVRGRQNVPGSARKSGARPTSWLEMP